MRKAIAGLLSSQIVDRRRRNVILRSVESLKAETCDGITCVEYFDDVSDR